MNDNYNIGSDKLEEQKQLIGKIYAESGNT